LPVAKQQQIGDAADADPAAAHRRQQLLAREDAVKEKVRAQATWPGFLFSCSPWAHPMLFLVPTRES
jgi:hypothetical protein